jgi:sortase A
MKKYYYKKHTIKKKNNLSHEKLLRFLGISLTILGLGIIFYFALPIITWQLLFTSAIASIKSPIPPPFILTPEMINAIKTDQQSKIIASDNIIKDDENWQLNYNFKKSTKPAVEFYLISIPKLNIQNAKVSTTNSDLTKNLVQYWGTPLPPLRGNTIIFGHSTLPSLFQSNNYKTIFANILSLKTGDIITVQLNKDSYTYKIFRIYITEPDDISILNQDTTGNYLTLITCTPPGTVWKRLIVKAQLTTND